MTSLAETYYSHAQLSDAAGCARKDQGDMLLLLLIGLFFGYVAVAVVVSAAIFLLIPV